MTIKVTLTFRDDIDEELYQHLQSLPIGRARTIFLSRLILAGFELNQKKGKIKAEKKHQGAESTKANRAGEMASPTPINEAPRRAVSAEVEHETIPTTEDDFTREFVKDLGGVPKR